MTTFLELLKNWNGGIERGAKRRFSKAIGVEEVTVGRWVNGKGMPDEPAHPKIAKALGVSVDVLVESIRAGARARHQGVEYGRVDEPRKADVVREEPDAYGGAMALLIGRIDQLTKQVADVQERCGALDHQIREMRERMDPREPKADRTPHESGGTRKKN